MGLWKHGDVQAVERIEDPAEADARVLDHLAELGCAPDEPRQTTHFVYLPTERGAVAVADALACRGWQTCVERAEESWLVVAVRVCSLTRETVRETRRTLEGLAAENHGVYDGWEARAD